MVAYATEGLRADPSLFRAAQLVMEGIWLQISSDKAIVEEESPTATN